MLATLTQHNTTQNNTKQHKTTQHNRMYIVASGPEGHGLLPPHLFEKVSEYYDRLYGYKLTYGSGDGLTVKTFTKLARHTEKRVKSFYRDISSKTCSVYESTAGVFKISDGISYVIESGSIFLEMSMRDMLCLTMRARHFLQFNRLSRPYRLREIHADDKDFVIDAAEFMYKIAEESKSDVEVHYCTDVRFSTSLFEAEIAELFLGLETVESEKNGLVSVLEDVLYDASGGRLLFVRPTFVTDISFFLPFKIAEIPQYRFLCAYDCLIFDNNALLEWYHHFVCTVERRLLFYEFVKIYGHIIDGPVSNYPMFKDLLRYRKFFFVVSDKVFPSERYDKALRWVATMACTVEVMCVPSRLLVME